MRHRAGARRRCEHGHSSLQAFAVAPFDCYVQRSDRFIMAVKASVGGMAAEVLEIFERYGLRHRDDDHTDRAIGLVREAALIYDAQPERPDAIQPRRYGLTGRQLRLLAEMYEDARLCVTNGIETCMRCDRRTCRRHAQALVQAERYSSLLRQLSAKFAAPAACGAPDDRR
jgi:hypothetical protein